MTQHGELTPNHSPSLVTRRVGMSGCGLMDFLRGHAIIAPQNEPDLLYFMMARLLAMVASDWRKLFQKRPWFLRTWASLRAQDA